MSQSSSNDDAWYTAARERQSTLTKPPGSLGVLEDVACRLAKIQRTPTPSASPARVIVAAGDHGFVSRDVSPYPQSVTGQMVANFASGGAAVNALARAAGASVEVLVVGLATPAPDVPVREGVRLVDAHVAAGTADAVEGPAMTPAQFDAAWTVGVEAIERAASDGVRVVALGEMGIGNTTAAAAVTAALLDRPAEAVTGVGTGADATMRARKIDVVDAVLRRHAGVSAPLEWLRCVGGLEMVALAGAADRAQTRGIAVVADGFISTAAIVAAVQARPPVGDVVFAGHRSSEPGHDALLEALGRTPLLDLGLRLGEASGAAAALPLLRAACAVHNEMATFASAGVDEGPAT
jgi:nicotinate-nucleotide--dimethylbenzimidazole phosphoribosyltransferase